MGRVEFGRDRRREEAEKHKGKAVHGLVDVVAWDWVVSVSVDEVGW